MAEIKSESVADFIPESVAGLLRNQHYVDAAIRRWQSFTGASAIHSATGDRFDSLILMKARDAQDG